MSYRESHHERVAQTSRRVETVAQVALAICIASICVIIASVFVRDCASQTEGRRPRACDSYVQVIGADAWSASASTCHGGQMATRQMDGSHLEVRCTCAASGR